MNENVNEHDSSDKKAEAERSGAPEAEPMPGAGAGAEPSAQSELEKLRHEILLQRADFINARRRLENQMRDEVRYAPTALVRELVQVVDHLELALNHATEDDPMRKGVALVLDGMLRTLAKFEVKKTGAKGEKFDPCRHEAVSVVSDRELADDVVAEVVRPGYTFHDRLIRAAGVLVNRLPHEDPGKK